MQVFHLLTYWLSVAVFTINKKGVLQLDTQLDYESVSYFEFMVIAMDMGDTPRSSSAIINVTVTDSNDNSPIFQFPAGPGFTVSVQVPEGNYSTANQLLTTVSYHMCQLGFSAFV